MIEDDGPPVVRRTAGFVLAAVLVVPAVLVYGFVLVWFLPEATGYTCAADDVACRRDPVNTVAWWLLLAVALGAAGALGVGWWRQWSATRWWAGPVAALGLVAAGVPLASVLSGG